MLHLLSSMQLVFEVMLLVITIRQMQEIFSFRYVFAKQGHKRFNHSDIETSLRNISPMDEIATRS